MVCVECLCSPSGEDVTGLRAGFSRPADGQWRGGALGTRPTTPRGGGEGDDFCVVLDTIT